MDMSSSIVHIIHYFEKGASLNVAGACYLSCTGQPGTPSPCVFSPPRQWALESELRSTAPSPWSYPNSSFTACLVFSNLSTCKFYIFASNQKYQFLTVNINLDFTDSVETIHHHIHDVIPTFTSTSTLIVYRLTNACVVNTKQGL